MNHRFEQDRQLLSKCISGDREATENLVRRFSDLVYRCVQYTLMARQIAFNRHDLEDLHATIFLRLFEKGCKKLRQYQGKNGCSLASWIRMIAVRIVLDHLRKKGLDAMVWQKGRISLEKMGELAAENSEPGAQIERAEQEHLLQRGMEKLLPRDRLFMKLHFEQGLSIAEVADTMRLSPGNAYAIKHRAIRRLKSHVASASEGQLRRGSV